MIHLGGSMDPDPAYLLIRGLKTLEVRVRRQCETALAAARFLERHPKVARCIIPVCHHIPTIARPAADARLWGYAGV